MEFGSLICVMLLSYYTKYIITLLFNKQQRTMVQQTNNKLEQLRQKAIKTKEEQLEFINLKNPKKVGKFKWTWMTIPKILLTIIFYIIIFRFYYLTFINLNINLKIWQGILFMIFFPLLINFLLEKFKLQKGDLSVFFR